MNKLYSEFIIQFLHFIKLNNVISIAVATIISNKINDVINSFIECLIMPIINRDGNNDGERDIKKLEEYTIYISGIKFKVGECLITLLKFFIIAYILFILTKIYSKYEKKYMIELSNI